MAEDSGGEKILPPSPRKLQKARDDGNVARSNDLSSAATLSTALLALLFLGPLMFAEMARATEHYFTHITFHQVTIDGAQPMTISVIGYLGRTMLPFMATMMVTGALVNLLQVGPMLSAKAIQPKFSRINPVSGMKRFVSMRMFIELIKSVFKISLITIIVYYATRDRWEAFIVLMELTPMGILIGVADLIIDVWWRVALAMIAIAILDFAYQRWQFMRDQRMTRREAQDEAKQLEGDPHVKQRIRQVQRQLATQRMLAEVPEADVIITNPIRFAVALRYDQGDMAAPKVVAKGARLMAQRIRDIAEENNVPIVQRPPLARALFKSVEIGQWVPESLFKAVAEVLAYVYQIDQRVAKRKERDATLDAVGGAA